MWDLPRPGLEPVSPALAGRFSTTAPPGKPEDLFFWFGCSRLSFSLFFINFFFLFLIFFSILITIYYYFFLLSFCFFHPFLLRCVAERVLVLWPIVKPEPLRWESRVQDIGRPEASQPHIISMGESSPRDLHLNAKTQCHSTTSKLQCWTPYGKKLARQEHKPTH